MRTHIGWTQFIIVCVVLLVLALLQQAPALSWFGVRPNLPLSFLVAVAFILSDFFIFAGLCLIAVALIGPTSGLSFEKSVFVALLVAVFFVRERIPLRPLSGIFCMTAIVTLAFYGIVDAGFLAFDSIAVFYEMIYNALIAMGFYIGLRRIFLHGKTTTPFF